MVSRSSVLDGLMVAAGIICLSQSIGGIERVIFNKSPTIMIFGAVWAVIFISAGTFLLRRAHERRKKRKAAERKAMELHMPIGLSIVTLQKSRNSRPRGVALIAYFSLIGGIFAVLLDGLSFASPELQSILQPMPNSFVSNPATSIVSAIASILVGYGMLRRKGWGWKWGVIGLFVSTGFSLADIIENPSIANIVSVVVLVGLNLLMLYYMYRPHVKGYFGISSNNPLVRQK